MKTAALAALVWAEAGLGVVGAGIAGTLWWAHRNAVDLPCSSGGGCELVNASRWAHLTVGPLHDVPVALLGFLAYLALLTLAMMKLGAETEPARRLLHAPLWAVSAFGAGYSWYLQYVAHFKIGAFCPWCFSSAVVMTLLLSAATAEGLLRSRPAPAPPDRPADTSDTRTATHV